MKAQEPVEDLGEQAGSQLNHLIDTWAVGKPMAGAGMAWEPGKLLVWCSCGSSVEFVVPEGPGIDFGPVTHDCEKNSWIVDAEICDHG